MTCLRLALHRPDFPPQRQFWSQSLKAMITSGMSSITGRQSLANWTQSQSSALCALNSIFFLFTGHFWYLLSLIWLADTGLAYPLPPLTHTIPTLTQNRKTRLTRTLTTKSIIRTIIQTRIRLLMAAMAAIYSMNNQTMRNSCWRMIPLTNKNGDET